MDYIFHETLVQEIVAISEMYQVELDNCKNVFDWWELLISKFDLEDTELMLSIFQRPPVHPGSKRFIRTLADHELKLRSMLH